MVGTYMSRPNQSGGVAHVANTRGSWLHRMRMVRERPRDRVNIVLAKRAEWAFAKCSLISSFQPRICHHPWQDLGFKLSARYRKLFGIPKRDT